ncbi:MAG: 30S ribosomal protein S17 [bacterium]|nr:30S ribosomal protein S17 [bacterium]
MEKSTSTLRKLEGTVVSTAMEKTCVVRVDGLKMHPKYQKAYRVKRNYHVHDPEGRAQVGMVVQFIACRPISKTKRWRLLA